MTNDQNPDPGKGNGRGSQQSSNEHATTEKPVGYGQPPIPTRFQPGVSGNPTGRPKGRRRLKHDLADALDRPTQTADGPATSQRAMIDKMVNRALGGDVRATQLLLRLYAELLSKEEPVDHAAPEDAELLAEAQARAVATHERGGQ